MSHHIVAPAHSHRSLAEWWAYLWKNRPVADETEFTREFREHGFGFALFTSWAAAIVGTINAVYRALFFKNHPPISQLLYGSYATPLYQALLESALLYWLVPLAFATFKSWSRRYYQWVLVVAYTYYFGALAWQIANGYRTLDDANISSVMLIVYSVVFLRIPFKHVAILTIISTVVVETLAVEYYGGEAFRLVITTTLSLVLSLYTSWRMEERDRSIFEKRIQAQQQHTLAQAAAKEADWQRSLAEQSAADADRHRSLAVEAAGEAERQKSLALESAADAERQRKEAQLTAAQAQLLHAEISTLYAQRELFIRGLHHDAMQSLHVMGGTLMVLNQKLSKEPSLQAIQPEMTQLEVGTRSLGHLISGMHDLVKLGQYVPRYEAVSVRAVLEHIDWQFCEQAHAKGLELKVRCRSQDLFVWTDRNALERILDNLVSNAIKYTVTGGVLVSTVKVGHILRIDVRDSGVGIPREHRDAIFREFVRLQQPGVKDVPGQGLGLAIVNLLRDKLRTSGFYLEHHSRVGHGSRFSVSLPLAAAPATPEPLAARGALDFSRVYVVIVEDNPLVQSTLCAVLRTAGYDVDDMVRIAGSLSELTSLFDKMPCRPPDVVVCDYTLSITETANDVIRLVDERFSWTTTVPIVVYSAEIQPAIAQGRPHTYVVLKSNDLTTLLTEMEGAVLKAPQDCDAPVE